MASESIRYIADISRQQAKVIGSKTATIFKDRKMSYAELDERASKVAQALLAEGIEPDARIAYLGKNNDEYFELFFGSLKARSVIVGVNIRLAVPEIAYIINDSKSELLFVTADYFPIVDELLKLCPNVKKVIAFETPFANHPSFSEWRDGHEAIDPFLAHNADDDIFQLYTSGTTGHPKGVQLTNANYEAAVKLTDDGYWPAWGADETSIVVMPLFHVAGVNVALIGLYSGCTNVIMEDPEPQALMHLIEKYQVNIAFMVPAVILFVTQQANVSEVDFSSLRLVIYGASPIAEDLLLEAKELFDCGFVQAYGMTETAGMGTTLLPEDHDPSLGKLRSCGKPRAGIKIKVVDGEGNEVPQGEVGEILINTPTNMKGYWNRPDATKESLVDNYMFTGDAGYFDEDGFLYIHDRIKDMILSGGENIYPAEVENALFAHPDVADAAAVGIPDEKWGEAVKGIVVLKPGKSTTPEDIIAHTKSLIAGFKTPKSIDFVDELPRNASGKILRRQLREPFWADQERKVN